jgi:PAS domain S-box-containing protein
VPYFKAGLENNEFCMWITSEPLSEKEAKEAMREALPDFDRYLKREQIEILPHDGWYLNEGTFNTQKVLKGWVDKLDQALAQDFDGLRLTGNTFWLEKKDWRNFTEYEKEINNVIGKYRMMAICSYSLEKCEASEVIDVLSNHQFALLRKEGKWETIERSQHKQAEQALRESEENYRQLTGSISDVFFEMDKDLRCTYWNRASEKLTGISAKDAIGKSLLKLFPDILITRKTKRVYLDVLRTQQPQTFINEYLFGGKDFFFDISVYPSKRGLSVFAKDITERMQSEEELREKEEFNFALFQHNPIEAIVVDRGGRVLKVNTAKRESGDRLPNIGDVMYKDYAAKHEIDMHAELRECIRSDKKKRFPVLKYGDKFLDITIASFPDGAIITSLDITERKRAEEALEESEAMFNKAEMIAHLGTFKLDKPTNKVKWSRQMHRIFGIKPEEFDGSLETTLNAIHPDDREHAMSVSEAAIRAKKPYQVEYRVVHPDGTELSVVAKAEAVYDERGELVEVVGTVQDITERKQAEEALQKSEKQFRISVETLLDGFAIFSAVRNKAGRIVDFRYEYINKSGCQLNKRTYKEQVGHTLLELLPAHKDTGLLDEYAQVVETGKPCTMESVIYEDTFGANRRLSRAFAFKAVKLGDGFAVTWKDVTESKRAEEMLKESEEKFRQFFENEPSYCYMISSEGLILDVNKSACRTLGYKKEELVGKNMKKIYAPESLRKMRANFAKWKKTGKLRDKELVILTKDGKRRTVLFSAAAVRNEAGKMLLSVSVQKDITESNLAEEEIKNSQLQLRNLAAHLQSVREEERTHIAREMHDELGQALTAMKMDLSWLDNRLPKDQKPLFEKIKSMSKLADNTIQTVKKISTELRPGLLDDLGLLAAIEWQAEEFQTRTGIKCAIITDPEDIILDKDRSTAIFRIFQETLTNVARHAKATKVKVSLKEKAGRIELKVRDNGKGITEEQVSNPKSFGLIGIKERAYYLDGKVVIKGLQDKGTTLTIRIPLPKKGKTK